MAQTRARGLVSLSLSAEDWAELCSLCPVFGLVAALRLLSSSAVPSARVPGFYHAFLSPLHQGDISTLQKRGHFYFALTRGKTW